ncbi:hypothetical protein FQN54_006985 [Arachnomyces sp. PD_36]|nr:hypothetical protein FQN54_006985 [Arachnomyces sp. PD_36]
MTAIWGYPPSRNPPPQSWDVFSFTAPPLKNGGEAGDGGQQRRLSLSRPSSPHILLFPQQCRLLHPKRRRPLADVDGEGTEAVQKKKKKRRLRLSFVTSRLSRPFSAPPTHIITRGSSKIAVWAKQKALKRSSLRRAAIMNRLRKNALSTRESEPHRFEMARWTFMYDYLITPSPTAATATTAATTAAITAPATNKAIAIPPPPTPPPPPRPPPHAPTAEQLAQIDKLISQPGSQPSCLRPTRRPISPTSSPPSPQPSPRKQYIPLPSSPFSLTNYDIFDNEDGYFDSSDGEDSDDEYGGGGGSNTTSPCNGRVNNDDTTSNNKGTKNKRKSSRIYSDFNVLEPSESVIDDDHDSLSAFDSLPFWGRWLPEVGSGSGEEDEKAAEMRLEKERQKEVSFVRFEI